MDRKSACFVAAAQLTAAAVIASGGKALPQWSPDISDASLRQLNLEDWEEFRIFYSAVKGAMDDETSWPSPASGSPASAPAMPAQLAALVQQLQPLAKAAAPELAAPLTQLIGLLTPLIASIPLPPQPAAAVPPAK